MATYYVSTTGSDAANGSEATPWQTMAHACATVGSADAIIVEAGLYEEAAVILAVPNVSITARGDGMAIIYGGEQVAGTWVNHSGNIWKITTIAADPGIILLRSSAQAHYTAFAKGLKMDALGELNADRKWYWDSGTTTLYLYSSAGNPSTAYYRVDYAPNSGTASLYASSGGFYALSADNLTMTRIAFYGFRSLGFAADDTDTITANDCDASFNGEDGFGGFNMPNLTVRGGRFCWNGTRKARSFVELLPDGDGISTHTGGAGGGSDGFLITGAYFEGNCKSAVQNIHDSAGTIERCISINNQLHFPLSSYNTSPQTVRDCKLVLAADDLGAFGCDAGCVGAYYNNTVYGAGTALIAAIFSINGTLTVTNNIFVNFAVGYSALAGSWTHTYNCWYDIDALGFVASTGEITTNPALSGTSNGQFGILRTSPCFNTGTDLSGSGVTHDFSGKRKSATAKSMGAMEPSRAGGSLLLSALFDEMDIL
jgi:hypothetical protein